MLQTVNEAKQKRENSMKPEQMNQEQIRTFIRCRTKEERDDFIRKNGIELSPEQLNAMNEKPDPAEKELPGREMPFIRRKC